MTRNASPSQRNRLANLASHRLVAFARMAWNTGLSSPGELEMMRNTSAVAFSRSSASFSCLVRASSFLCRLPAEGLSWGGVVGALLRFGFILPCLFFAGLPLMVRGRSTWRSPEATVQAYHVMGSVVHHSKLAPDVCVASQL